MRTVVILLIVLAGPARADDYCEHVEAVAAAESALMFAPDGFATFGYVRAADDPVTTRAPRLTAGIEYRLTGILRGAATRAQATAECNRQRALVAVQSATDYGGVAARVRVLDAALPEAEQLLAKVAADVSERLATEHEHIAMRLRVDELRSLASQARKQLAAQPAPSAKTTLANLYDADDDVERQAARLRKLDAFDVTVRGGYDRFVDRADDQPYFAMVTVAVNTGVLAQGSANHRAAAARRRMIRKHAAAELEAALVAETERATQTSQLIGDLEAQIAKIAKLGGNDGRRYAQTLWFDLIKLKAEHAAATAQATSLRELLQR